MKTVVWRKAALTALVSLPVILFAAQASALSFDEAVETAMNQSHELKQLKLETQYVTWDVTKARASYMPRLDLTGRHLFAERFEELEIEFGGAQFVMPAIQPYTSLGVTASVDVFTGFQRCSQLKAARAAQVASEARLDRAKERVRAGVRTLFYRALGSQILADVAEQNIKTLEEHRHDVQSRYRSGVSTKFDTLRIDVQIEDAQTDLLAAQNAVVINRARLFDALGIQDDGKPLAGQMPADFNNYENLTLSMNDVHRADRAASVADVERSQSLARAAKAHWYPKVSLFGSYEWYNNFNHSIWAEDERFKPASSFGVLLKWNLFDGGASLASQRQAALAEEISQEKLAQLDQVLPTDLEEAKRRLSYDLYAHKAKQASVRKAQEAVRLARGGLRAGTLTETEVLDAVLDLNRAKAAAVRTQIDAIEAIGQLELAVGHPI